VPVDQVHVRGLRELRAQLKDLEGDFPKRLRLAAKKAAEVVAARGRTDAGTGTPQQQLLAPTIRAAATQMAAKVVVGNNRYPFALAAFLGGRYKTGWYSDERYAESYGAQFPPWVGNQWDPGESWEGHVPGEPYILGGTIRHVKDEVLEVYLDELDEITRDAFPS
jgi:hypothetical protein